MKKPNKKINLNDDKEDSGEIFKSNKDLLVEAISKLSPEDLSLIYPKIGRAQKKEEEIHISK